VETHGSFSFAAELVVSNQERGLYMSDYVEKFTGQVTIKVRFQNAGEYAKFRKYILKTAWNVGDKYPTFEVMTLPFYDIEDVENITKRIVQLLQLGLEVYASNWKVERQLAEEEFPQDDEPDEGDTDGNHIPAGSLAEWSNRVDAALRKAMFGGQKSQ